MILYNMRYRGPLEYDKFALNILQFHNDVFFRDKNEFSSLSEDEVTLLTIQMDINTAFNNSINKAEELYNEILQYKECF
jgi:hypothetical protein